MDKEPSLVSALFSRLVSALIGQETRGQRKVKPSLISHEYIGH